MSLLQISGLTLGISGIPVLDGIDLEMEAGEVHALVGESGSGKSMTALSIMQLLPEGAQLSGSIRFDGAELVGIGEPAMCRLRGDDIGMVFQEPMTALNPLHTIGDQITEGIRLHMRARRRQADARMREMLSRVGLPSERIPPWRYPHELSGGQRQRVGIAIACALDPKLLIADEPTTALDVTIQAQILKLLHELVREKGTALLLISHDLGVVAEMADRITIMRHGRVVESGEAVSVLTARRHPYTAALAKASTHVPERATPPLSHETARQRGLSPLLSVRNLVCEYDAGRSGLFAPRKKFRAVDDVSFDLHAGQTLGLVGESGCGKSTLARTLLGLQEAASGEIRFDGARLTSNGETDVSPARREMQIVFQDPYGSFNPRHKVERLLAEPLHTRQELSAAEKHGRVVAAIKSVGLHAGDLHKYIHEFSGGQRQRLAIARALVSRPKLIIADEPVSALDVSIRAQILDLLSDLRDRLNLSYLFISHDLTVVRAICDEVLIMRAGKILESGPVKQVFEHPREPYTRELIAAAPDLEAALRRRLETAIARS